MYSKDIENRISHIQETIKSTEAQIQGYTMSLQQSNQQLSSLHGHLNECVHWKQQIELEQTNLQTSQLIADDIHPVTMDSL